MSHDQSIIVPGIQQQQHVLAVEGQVVLHCRKTIMGLTHYRICPDTHLISGDGSKSALLFAFSIEIAPKWSTAFLFHGDVCFTLIFEPLERTSDGFYMQEITPEGKLAFYTEWVKRNSTDVYRVQVFD